LISIHNRYFKQGAHNARRTIERNIECSVGTPDYRPFTLWFVRSRYEARGCTVINSSSQQFIKIGSMDVPQERRSAEVRTKHAPATFGVSD